MTPFEYLTDVELARDGTGASLSEAVLDRAVNDYWRKRFPRPEGRVLLLHPDDGRLEAAA